MAEQKTYILLDDDEIVRLTWKMAAEISNIKLHSFSCPSALFNEYETLDKNSIIFIDYHLPEMKGDEVAKKLLSAGFNQLYLTTGDTQLKFPHLFLGNSGKVPPWI